MSRLIHSRILFLVRKNFIREPSNREVIDKPKSADHFTHSASVAITAGTMHGNRPSNKKRLDTRNEGV